MKKLKDLEDKEKDATEDHIWSSVNAVDGKRETINPLGKFGMCGSCKRFEYAETEFDFIYSKCSEFGMKINEKTPIRNCSSFEEKGTMTIRDMQSIAWILDFDERKVGF